MADGWIELFDIETDEAELLFVFDRFEPLDYGCGFFPLVEVVFFRDCAVDAGEDVFADFAYLGLSGVDDRPASSSSFASRPNVHFSDNLSAELVVYLFFFLPYIPRSTSMY